MLPNAIENKGDNAQDDEKPRKETPESSGSHSNHGKATLKKTREVSQKSNEITRKEPQQLNDSPSDVIGALKLLPYSSSVEELGDASSPIQAVQGETSKNGSDSGFGPSGSCKKIWKFERDKSIKFPEDDELINKSETQKLKGSESPSKFLVSRQRSNSSVLAVNNFFAFEAAQATLKSKTPSKEAESSPTPKPPLKRQDSIKVFRNQQKFFELVTRGHFSDLNEIESILVNDPSSNIYEQSDPAALINRPNRNGQTPLYHAVKNGSLPVVKLFAKHGADFSLNSEVKTTENKNNTESLIETAAKWSHVDIIQFLLANFQWSQSQIKAAVAKTNVKSIKKALGVLGESPSKTKKRSIFQSILACLGIPKKKAT